MKRGIAVAAAASLAAEACTVLVAGRKATADGSTMVSHTTDAGGGTKDLRLVRIPAKDHPKGSKRAVLKHVQNYPRIVTNDRSELYKPVEGQELSPVLGYIDEVEHTYAYWELDYGLMNEHKLAMGESTVNARTVGFPKDQGNYGQCVMSIQELSRIGLERCKTSRCAVQTMGDLAVEHGFFSGQNNPKRP